MTMDGVTVRVAAPADAMAVAAIYADAISTPASFEEVAPSAAEIERRIRHVLEWTPWLVAIGAAGEVVGYAYAGRHRERAGYRWSVDVSAYVAHAHRGRGVGRQLYDALIPILRRQGFVNVYAGIALPNVASVALHVAIGMEPIGVYRKVGYKLGAWHDVAWYGMRLSTSAHPTEPIAFPALSGPVGAPPER
jgi:L-amino acid N-acyltransferase YncA